MNAAVQPPFKRASLYCLHKLKVHVGEGEGIMGSTATGFGKGKACVMALAGFIACALPAAAADDPAHALAQKFANEAAKIEAQEKRAAERIAEQRKAAAERKAAAVRARREKAEAAEKARVAAQRAADEAEMLRKAAAEEKQRQLAEQQRAEKKRIEAERKLARQNAKRIAEEAQRQRAELERKAEVARRAEAERLIREVEAQRIADEKRLAAERKAAEAKKRAAEARIAEIRRQAAAAEKKRRDEEARVVDLKRRAQAAEAERRAHEERLAQQQRLAEAAAAKKRAALEAAREEEARRIAEKFRLAREAREARNAQAARDVRAASARTQPDTRPLADMGARSSLGGPIPAATPPASPFIAQPAARTGPPAVKATAATAARTRVMAAPVYPQRVTVLIEMDARRHGFMGKKMTANPVLCVADSCYVSNGATMAATAMNRRKALGPGNTLGRNAGACRNDTTCVFRGVLLPSASATIQPVDMGMLRHDRRQIRSVKPDTSCRASNGQLTCATPIVASRYRAWIVPEQVAEAAGSRALEIALDAGLPASRATYGSWDTTVRTR